MHDFFLRLNLTKPKVITERPVTVSIYHLNLNVATDLSNACSLHNSEENVKVLKFPDSKSFKSDNAESLLYYAQVSR